MTDDIFELRGQIDAIDDQLLALMQRRAAIAIEMGALKKHRNLAVQDRAREKQILNRLTGAACGGPLAGEAVREIFENIIKACRAAQAPIRVAFAGPVGSLNHAAACTYYGALGVYQAQKDEASIFLAVESGQADIAVVIMEQAPEGMAGRTLDLLARTALKARGLISQTGTLALLSQSGQVDLIKKVVAEPAVLAQTESWRQQNLPSAETTTASTPAEAARLAAADGTSAMIGPAALADYFRLTIAAENVAPAAGTNYYLILGHEPGTATGQDRTLCCFAAGKNSGGLYRCLAPLAEAGLSLTRLNSRPGPNPGGHLFFLELEGHYSDSNVACGLAALKQTAESFTLIGSYEAPENQRVASI